MSLPVRALRIQIGVVMLFTLEQKMAALAMRFYQGMKWEPKVGDHYCLTREGTELFTITRTDGENFFIQRVYAPGQTESHEQQDPWPIAKFQEDFGVNRVWVHPIILERMAPRFEHQGPASIEAQGRNLRTCGYQILPLKYQGRKAGRAA